MRDCDSESDITRMIAALDDGDARTAERLLDAVYDELRALARVRLQREKPGQTLDATALVHEAYLRIVGSAGDGWSGRAHFFGAAAEAMRRILVDQARRKSAVKRGGGRRREDLQDELITVRSDDDTDLELLSEALDDLEREDPVKAQLVKLRYFVGLTIPQAAEALEISQTTADRYWTYSRARLYHRLSE
jgi:RNA polymerase sigma factor (TIGR02999 family)